MFIEPDVIRDDMRAIRMVQQLASRQGNALQAFVVVLSGPDPELEARLRMSAEAERLTVPLAVLAEQAAVRAIHKALPVRRGTAITALLYRGQASCTCSPTSISAVL